MAPGAFAGARAGRGAKDRGKASERVALGPGEHRAPLKTVAAPAKVNLFLHVLGRRADGYHLLDSLVAFGPVGDMVTAAAADTFTLAVDGPEAGALTSEPDNLVLRAARLLAAEAGMAAAAALTLDKHLPVASGIGGGSADAAATLRALDRLWRLGWGEARLAALAGRLGADVPACVLSRPVRLGGVGEVLTPAPRLPACGLLLVNPRVPLETPAVFAARTGAFSAPAVLPEGWPDAAAMARDLGALRNDLEAPAIALCPPVAAVLAVLRGLPGCLLARMSGSGATCFGLFGSGAAAARAGNTLPAGWWRGAGDLYAAPG